MPDLATASPRSLARHFLVAGVAAFAVAVGPASAAAATSQAARPCLNADLVPTAANVSQVRAAILCLTNRDRMRRGESPLRQNARLSTAATAHSKDMVRTQYFAHTTPGGTTFVGRVFAARYVGRNGRWALGENLAWGTGDLGTAAGVQAAWMRSSDHRANILNSAYHDIGIGIQMGIPTDVDAGATFTADFGDKS